MATSRAVTLAEEIGKFEFDHCFTIHPDGSLTEPHGIWSPSVYHDDEDDIHIDGGGWSAITGMTGQDSYHGAVMHPSEYVGSGIADLLLEMAADEPLTFVLTTVEVLATDDDPEPEPVGWAILYHNPEGI